MEAVNEWSVSYRVDCNRRTYTDLTEEKARARFLGMTDMAERVITYVSIDIYPSIEVVLLQGRKVIDRRFYADGHEKRLSWFPGISRP